MTPKRWRTEAGLSLRKVAALLNCGRMTVLRYETGEREPPLSVVMRWRAVSEGAVSDLDLVKVRRRFLQGTSRAA